MVTHVILCTNHSILVIKSARVHYLLKSTHCHKLLCYLLMLQITIAF